jgi:nucleoside-diphosphate-sugar epimerase
MIAYRHEESEAAAGAFRGRVGRFIHCSTISVYMVSNDVRCPITEDQDRGALMEHFDRNPFGMDYGIRKRECESVLWSMHDERQLPVTMLRPTFVSGPADPTGRDWFWIQRIASGGPLLVPGSGDYPFQQVYVEDVASMFARLLDLPGTIGRVYNIAAEEVMTLNGYLAQVARLLDRTPELIHVDQEEFDALPFSSSPRGDVFPFNTRRPAIFSLDRIVADCGYRSTPFETWMRETIRWWTAPGRPDSTGWSLRGDESAYAALKTGRRLP